MLMMNAEYARMRDEKAEQTMQWLVRNLRVQPFTTPKIATIDVTTAVGDDRAPASAPRAPRRARVRDGV